MKLTIPPGQMKIVIPLLAVLAVALTMTVVKMRTAIQQSRAPAQASAQAVSPSDGPGPTAGAARTPAFNPVSRGAIAQAASERNPFDSSRLSGPAQSPAAAPAPRYRPRQVSSLPPASISIGNLEASAQGRWGSEPGSQQIPEPAPAPEFKLNAIIESSGDSIAIISVGGSQLQAVREGQQMDGGYRVVFIGEGVVRLSSPGRTPVRLSLPGSEGSGGGSPRMVTPVRPAPPRRPSLASTTLPDESTPPEQAHPGALASVDAIEVKEIPAPADPDQSDSPGEPSPPPASPDAIQVIAQKSEEQYE